MFTSKDVYKALWFFFFAQLGVLTIGVAEVTPKFAGALNVVSVAIGATAILFAIKEINRRQAVDDTRRAFRMTTVFQVTTVMLIAVFALTVLFEQLGVSDTPQSNQESLEGLIALFPIAMLFAIVFVAPVVEELVFRELLPFATGPSIVSFIVSSLIFMALHTPTGIVGWASYGIVTSGLLYARLKDNNVYTSIVVHILWNAVSIIVLM